MSTLREVMISRIKRRDANGRSDMGAELAALVTGAPVLILPDVLRGALVEWAANNNDESVTAWTLTAFENECAAAGARFVRVAPNGSYAPA
jgi:hypothetical protein